MSKFIPFTEEEIYMAAHTEIKSILESSKAYHLKQQSLRDTVGGKAPLRKH